MSFLASLGDEPELFFDYDAVADRWVCSASLRALYRVPPEQDPTTSLMLERVHEQDRPVVRTRFQEALGAPRPFSLEYRLLDADGRTRRLVLVGQSEAVEGKVTRLSGSVVDITETIRNGAAEAVLASSEHRATIEQAKGALMVAFGIGEDVAFEMLRTYSNHHNTKLVHVAEHITAGVVDPAFVSADPVRSLVDILIHLGRREPREAMGTAS